MPNLPPSCHTNLGVGAMVFNDTDHLLAISEKHYEYPHWKLPGGYVERGKYFDDKSDSYVHYLTYTHIYRANTTHT